MAAGRPSSSSNIASPPDDGVAATPFWAARSVVQITNAAIGSVYMGREYGPEFWPAVKTDPFGWDGVGQISSMQYANFSTSLNGASFIRTSNTAGFKSRSFGGLTVNLAASLGEGAAGLPAVFVGAQLRIRWRPDLTLAWASPAFPKARTTVTNW